MMLERSDESTAFVVSAPRLWTQPQPGRCARRQSAGGTVMRARADRKLSSMKEQVFTSIKGLEKGYGSVVIDEDMDDDIDDLVENLEDNNPTKSARDSEYMIGRWKLAFTSSSSSRFAKGISGIHSLLPLGQSLELEQIIEPEDLRSYLVEKVSYFGGALKGDALIVGQYKWITENKLAWMPDTIKLWFLRFQAESGWRAMSGFKSVEVTFLDYEVKVERGEAGQVYIWKRVE